MIGIRVHADTTRNPRRSTVTSTRERASMARPTTTSGRPVSAAVPASLAGALAAATNPSTTTTAPIPANHPLPVRPRHATRAVAGISSGATSCAGTGSAARTRTATGIAAAAAPTPSSTTLHATGKVPSPTAADAAIAIHPVPSMPATRFVTSSTVAAVRRSRARRAATASATATTARPRASASISQGEPHPSGVPSAAKCTAMRAGSSGASRTAAVPSARAMTAAGATTATRAPVGRGEGAVVVIVLP